jgi:CDP-glycerol glycerophosphotransferase
MAAGLLSGLVRESKRRLLLARALAWIATHKRAAAKIREEQAWIFGASVGRAYTDNSAALHQHVRRERPDIAAYWAIDRDSADVAAAAAHGPILFRDSVEAWVRGLLAAVHVISHGVHDVPACASPRSRKAVKVRLGHGLTALKRTKPRRGHDNRSANAVFDLVPVASEFEKAHKIDWEIDPERLVVTGLARFDTLVARNRETADDPKRLVYMPTWRDDADPEGLRQAIGGLLAAPELKALLDRHDARLDVFLHVNFGAGFRAEMARTGGGRIRFPGLSDPQPLFAEAGLLVTDYSSVAWDMLYIDKPVIFYQFDPERFAAARGGYLEPDQLPGPLASDPDGVVALVDAYLTGAWRNDSGWTSRMRSGQERAFAFRDSGNCERIVQHIERLLAERRAKDGAC